MHPSDAELALYAGRDLGLWPRFHIARHLRRCELCSRHVEEFRGIQQWLGEDGPEIPGDIEWNSLAAEMRANIRLGLAAGRCVATAEAEPLRAHWLRPVMALPVLLVVLATWIAGSLHPPLNRATASLEPLPAAAGAELVLESSPTQTGVEQGGRGFALLHPRGENVVSSVRGDAVRVRYVDSDTGQVTISHVYAQ